MPRAVTGISSTPACTRPTDGSRSCGRRRPTRALRASRARSGTRCARCSTPTTSGARQSAARSSRLTWPIDAAPTERERLRSLAGLAAGRPKGGRGVWRSRTGGAGSSPARAGHSRDRRRSGTHEPWRCSAAVRRSGSPISSGWPAAPPPGSSSATSAPARSIRRSTHGCAARSPTSPCSGSTASCRVRSRVPSG